LLRLAQEHIEACKSKGEQVSHADDIAALEAWEPHGEITITGDLVHMDVTRRSLEKLTDMDCKYVWCLIDEYIVNKLHARHRDMWLLAVRRLAAHTRGNSRVEGCEMAACHISVMLMRALVAWVDSGH
jgi:hypothetical protein